MFTFLKSSFNTRVLLVLGGLHVVFIVVFDKVTAFAPDENYYAAVFGSMYSSGFSISEGLGWQQGSVNGLRLIYLPAKALTLIGFSDLYSIRILSAAYSIISLFLLLKMSSTRKILGLSTRTWISVAFFIPSIFLWGSLGLRESFIFFSVISIFYLLNENSNLAFRRRFILLAGASCFILVSKNYLYVFLLISILISLVLMCVTKGHLEIKLFKLLPALLIPLLVFPTVTLNIAVSAKEAIEVKLGELADTGTAGTGTAGTGTAGTGTAGTGTAGTGTAGTGTAGTGTAGTGTTNTVPTRGQTLHELSLQFDKNPIFSWLGNVSGVKSLIEEKSKSSYVPAGSIELIENARQLQTQQPSLRDPLSILKGIFNFLFVPTPFLDNGSFFLNAQSYESFAWYLYYLLLLILLMRLVKGHQVLSLQILASTLFTLGFLLFSVLIETNDGTSVRHRAVLLMGILIMLAAMSQMSNKREEIQ